jgi:hypothetical protein
MLVLNNSWKPDGTEASSGNNYDISFRDCRIHQICNKITKLSLFIMATLEINLIFCEGN